jgi:hypothetical protein
MAATVRRKVDYSADPVMTDDAFRRRMMTDICRAGLAIEQALGSAQVCLCVCVCVHMLVYGARPVEK